MKIERKDLFLLIVIDLAVMLMAFAFIVVRYRALTASVRPVETVQAEIEKSRDSAETGGKKGASNFRNISFLYRNAKAEKVEIAGDFTDWVPQKLNKNNNGQWEIIVPIAPGKYAYNYIVDGKPICDPYNPKVCDTGHGFVNSYLVVKPLNEAGDTSE